MKQILKSIATIGALSSMLVASTGAYFSSNISAADNEINVGTLRLAVDSTRAHSYVGTWNTGTGLSWDGVTPVGNPFDAYNVMYDNNGVLVFQNNLEPWANAEPGVYSSYLGSTGIETLPAGNRSIWMAVRNLGSIDAKAAVSFTGHWTGLRTTDGCAAEGAGNDSLIRLRNVHLYKIGASNCEDHEECRNLRDGLAVAGIPATYTTDTDLSTTVNWSPNSVLNGASFALSSTGTTGGNSIALGENEYAIARVDMQFAPTISGVNYNCYQGATYLYDVTVNGTQVGDPAW